MVQAYRTDNPWSGVARGYGLGNALRGDVVRSRAGSAIAGGDYTGGANALLTNGDITSGFAVQDYGQRQQAVAANAKKASEEAGLKFTSEIAGRLAEVHRSTKDVNKTLQQFDAVAPQLAKYDTPEEIAALRQQIAADPDNTLLMLGAGAAKQLGYDVQGSGDEVLVIDKATGKLVNRYRGSRTTKLGAGEDLLELPGDAGTAPPAVGESPVPAVAPTSASGGQPDPEAVWQAAIQQESGGRAGVLGPQTDYGRAEGLTQMLPATAEAMARKLGIAWNPALMRENSPKAKAYQERLGRAYFEEGLEKFGNVEDALRYYHGGPNQELWGPKTEAHVRAVMSRVQPYETSALGETPPPSGARVIASRPAAAKEQWVDLPGGGQRNTLTGKTEGVPRSNGKLSAAALNQQNEHLGALQASSAMNTKLDRVKSLLDGGKLDLGVAKNIVARGQNAIGFSSEESRNFASLRADLEKIRNDSLRLNKGVQTEGDAQRAWNELLTNLNDAKLVRQRLEEIEAYNRQAIAFHQDMVTQIRQDSGMAPIDLRKFEAKPLTIPTGASKSGWSITPVNR